MAKSIEGLTTEEQATFRSEIGAGAPPTTESVLALLDGETVPLDGVILGDQGDLVPALEGALIRNGNSLAWSQDPADEIAGGLIIYDESRSFGCKSILAAEYASVGVRKILGSVWIPSRYAVAGKFLEIFGSLKVNSNSGALPFGAMFGFVTEDFKLIAASPAGEILGFSLLDINGVCSYQNLAGYIPITAVSGDASKVELASVADYGSASGVKIPSSGTVVSAPVPALDIYASGAGISNTPAGEGSPLYLVVDIPSGSVPSISLSVFWDFTIRGR